LLEFTKKRQWWVFPHQCQTNFARTSGSHTLWILNQVQSLCNSFSNHNHHGNRPSNSTLSHRQFSQFSSCSQFK
jgi:hypothetical protein